MFISYAIMTHNEGQYISNLFEMLFDFINASKEKDVKYEVVVLDDNSKDPSTQMNLRIATTMPFFKVSYRQHEGDFSAQKNALTDLCQGDWIINLDADEWMPAALMSMIPDIIKLNTEVEAFWVPRINTVRGLTEKHMKQWNWKCTTFDSFFETRRVPKDSEEHRFLKDRGLIIKDEEDTTYWLPIIMWPDYQMRVYKRSPDIRWVNKVHEQLVGYHRYSSFPEHPDFAIRHFKTIDRQEEQNALYDKIAREL